MNDSARTAYPLDLPSKGLPYGGKVLNGQIEVYPLRAKDQKLLSGFSSSKRNEALNLLLKTCLKAQIDPKELTTSDRFFVLLWLRILSLGEDYEVEFNCPNCSTRFKDTINLNSFEIKTLPDSFIEPFEVELPDSKDKVGFRLLRGEDEAAIQRYSDRINHKQQIGDDTFIFRLSRQMLTLNGESIGDRDKTEYIENLSLKDYQAIETALADNDSGLIPDVTVDCPKCDYQIETSLPVSPNFFRSRK